MIPENAPFSPEQRAALTALLQSFTSEQSFWLSGYLAGGAAVKAAPAAASQSSVPLTVLYGTESGNSEMLADKTVKAAKKRGFKAKMVNMSETNPRALAKAENLLVIVSTWGDGEPPETAEAFYDEFMRQEADYSKLNYSVCALGDTSYEKFCQIGKDIDARLEKLGAKRKVDRVDCDVDFDDAYDGWVQKAFDALGGSAPSSATVIPAPMAFEPAVTYDKKNPFPAEVITNQLLNGVGSAKETIHVELDLEGSGLTYEAGDALAVVPTNAPDVVADILEATGLDGAAKVTPKGGEETSLIDALTHDLDITALSRAVAKKYAALSDIKGLAELLDESDKKKFANYAVGRQIIDLVKDFPDPDLTPQAFVDCLRKLPPRLYSIASSPKAHEGEVHLTVAAVRYNTYDKDRKGVASTYLADFAKEGDKVLVYVHKNKNFRLPEDASTPVIMVGPGTGIAPFRAFIEERAETGNEGGSWLFFGDQRYSYDFLYQLELQDHLKEGSLTKLDVAFSRDQPQKIYVQDRMRERAAEIWQWLEKGAYFYVCGDAQYMAADVHQALIDIAASEGGKSPEDAKAFVDQLKKDKRYQRDVY